MDTQPTPSETNGIRGQGSVNPETGLNQAPETAAPASVEAGTSGPSTGGQPSQSGSSLPKKLTPDDVAAVIAGQTTPSAPVTAPTMGPQMAEDVDVIEPEWVDKAEQVVQQTQNDPYKEEEAVEDLQRDYLKKRYNYDVSDPNVDDDKPEGT
jgi:hypothetical protein